MNDKQLFWHVYTCINNEQLIGKKFWWQQFHLSIFRLSNEFYERMNKQYFEQYLRFLDIQSDLHTFYSLTIVTNNRILYHLQKILHHGKLFNNVFSETWYFSSLHVKILLLFSSITLISFSSTYSWYITFFQERNELVLTHVNWCQFFFIFSFSSIACDIFGFQYTLHRNT